MAAWRLGCPIPLKTLKPTLTLQVPTIEGTRAPRALYSRYLEG